MWVGGGGVGSLNGLPLDASVLALLVGALASAAIVYAWRLHSMIRGVDMWLCFTLAIALSMAAVYCFLVLPLSVDVEAVLVGVCYLFMGVAIFCYRRWLGSLLHLVSRHSKPPIHSGHSSCERPVEPGEAAPRASCGASGCERDDGGCG